MVKSERRKNLKTGLTKREKTTEIYFDEKEPIIYIRTHNTDLKNRLSSYSRKYPVHCKLTAEDDETGLTEFEVAKGRFSFRLTAPYTEERRAAARRYAKEHCSADRLKCGGSEREKR